MPVVIFQYILGGAQRGSFNLSGGGNSKTIDINGTYGILIVDEHSTSGACIIAVVALTDISTLGGAGNVQSLSFSCPETRKVTITSNFEEGRTSGHNWTFIGTSI